MYFHTYINEYEYLKKDEYEYFFGQPQIFMSRVVETIGMHPIELADGFNIQSKYIIYPISLQRINDFA